MKNKKRVNKLLVIIIVILSLLLVIDGYIILNKYVFNKEEYQNDVYKLSIDKKPVIHETKFGGVYIKITIDEFNQLGFKYGDSVNIKFSNGYELLDIPYYNGYYVDMGEALLIAYPGYDYIKVAINYGDDVWKLANLSDSDTAMVILNEEAKYIKTQNASDIHYSDDQGEMTDIVFGNFRNVSVGNIKENILYRSASPSDNTHNRAAVVDRLIKEVGVNYIINLSDSESDLIEEINKDDFNSPYFLSLYNSKKVVPLSMNMQFKEKSFKEGLVKGLTAMANNDGPYLIHCVEGKDRTGYVLMIIEALMGSSYNEIIDDYMITYDNYYGINKYSDIERYETIKSRNIDIMLHYMIGDTNQTKDLSKIDDYGFYAKQYLLLIGMNENDIDMLINKLSE